MGRCEHIIRYIRTLIGMRIHTQRSSVDYDKVLGHHLRSKITISHGIVVGATDTRHHSSLQTEIHQTMAHSTCRATGSKHKSLAVLRLQQRTQRIAETHDIGVVAHQVHIAMGGAFHLDDIDGTYLLRATVNRVKKGYHLLLVRQRHIKSLQIGVLGKYVEQPRYVINLEIEIAGRYALRLKLLIEIRV